MNSKYGIKLKDKSGIISFWDYIRKNNIKAYFTLTGPYDFVIMVEKSTATYLALKFECEIISEK